MVGKVAERREARTQEIVDAAWELARVEGIGGFSLHGVARALGIRQPSLYEYFASKLALYDAMFADGNRNLLTRLEALSLPGDSRRAVKAYMHEFVEFAVEVLARTGVLLRAAGMRSQGDIDCFVAMVGGLITSQLSNEPGGTRWVRHLDRLIDLYLDDLVGRRRR